MTTATQLTSNEIRVYWQPGCTSCLRTKEFLIRHGIPFASRNVLGDDQAFEELAHFGLRQVPIVTKGESWANGQVLADVVSSIGVLAEENDVEVRVQPPARDLRVGVERAIAAQILQPVVENACRFAQSQVLLGAGRNGYL